MLSVIAPLEIEIKRLRTLLEVDSAVYFHPGRIWHGQLGGHEVCLARAGSGKAAAARCTAHCIRLFRPDILLLIGFGGATDPTLHSGDLVICEEIIDVTTHQRYHAEKAVVAQASRAAAQTGHAARVGSAVTASAVVTSPHEKAFFGTQHGTTIVELEGSGFAAAAEAAAVPWLMLRAVVDSMETALPDGLYCREDGTIPLTAVVSLLCQHPRVIGQLSSLHMAAIKARNSITQLTMELISHP